jgi:hypothetical protein
MPQKETRLTVLISAFGRAYHSQYMTEEFSGISSHMLQGLAFLNKDGRQTVPDSPEQQLKWITLGKLKTSPRPNGGGTFRRGRTPTACLFSHLIKFMVQLHQRPLLNP